MLLGGGRRAMEALEEASEHIVVWVPVRRVGDGQRAKGGVYLIAVRQLDEGERARHVRDLIRRDRHALVSEGLGEGGQVSDRTWAHPTSASTPEARTVSMSSLYLRTTPRVLSTS